MTPFPLGGRVRLPELLDVAVRGRMVRLPRAASARVRASRRLVERAVAAGRVVYGVNTGFGELASERIPADSVRRLQLNLLRSHACGVGEPLPPEASRAMLFLRANELARGRSGCRLELVEFLAAMLDRGVAPVVPSRGSVGASGDLAPQAHAALVVIGEGRARVREARGWSAPLPGREALSRAGLKPLGLESKEGLSLINGTQAMQAVGGLALARSLLVLGAADAAGAMSLEAIRGTPAPFDEPLVRLKPHPGQLRVASRMRKLLDASEIRESHREGDLRVQDPYSFRCIPQVHGAASDALGFALKTLETEMASVTDNPAVAGGRVVSGGNFHGQALAMACDFAALALVCLGNVSERRIFQLILGQNGLPPFLAAEPGLESGFMIPQVVAAALASENKVLAHPASADSIPTSAEKEDFVSMGMGAALKLSKAASTAAQIVAIELLAAARGVERHRPLAPGAGVARALALLRARVPASRGDKSLAGEMEAVREMILEGRFEGVV